MNSGRMERSNDTGLGGAFGLMALESRWMFDGAAAVDIADTVDSDAPAMDAAILPEAGKAGNSGQVVFIDGGVDDINALQAAVPVGSEVFILDPSRDGIMQIAEILDGFEGLSSVHVISHGDVGAVTLGGVRIDGGSLDGNAEVLASWGQALSETGDILFYGCSVGADGAGTAFLDRVAVLTGADVAGSDDLTGAAALGGDWDLEAAAGSIETTAIAAPAYSGVLVNLIANGDFSSGNASFTSDYTFLNGAFNLLAGQYDVQDQASDLRNDGAWTSAYGHTSGVAGDNYFIGNGSSNTSTVVWQSNSAITVTADTIYRFEAYVSTVYGVSADGAGYNGTDGPSLKFQLGDGGGGANWVDLGTTFDFSVGATVGQWNLSYADGKFTSGGTYYVRLMNNQPAANGNDFGVDDIYFGTRTDAPSVGSNPGASTVGTFDTSTYSQSPTVTAGGTTAFTEQTATAVASGITINDSDGDADWNGGTLKVQITANNSAGDGLSLPTANPGGSGIWIDGANLMAGSTQIGTADAASVSSGTAWTFTLNASATNALVQDVGRAVKFSNASDAPSTANRTVTFTATDKNSASSFATQTITVAAVNDLPTGTDKSLSVSHNTAKTVATADLGFADVDGDTLNQIQITTAPTVGTLFNDADADGVVDGGEALAATDTVSKADLDAGRLKFLPATGGVGAAYATFGFKVHDGTAYAAAASTVTLDVAAAAITTTNAKPPAPTAPAPAPQASAPVNMVGLATGSGLSTVINSTPMTGPVVVAASQGNAGIGGDVQAPRPTAVFQVTTVTPTAGVTRDGSLFVYQGIPNQVTEARTITFTVPQDAFGHTDEQAAVQLSARLAEGGALPGWLNFDARSGTFAGEAPQGFSGVVNVLISARDGAGNEVTTIFQLIIGGGAVQQPADGVAPPGGEGEGVDRQGEGNTNPSPTSDQGADVSPVLKGKPSLSQQLRAAMIGSPNDNNSRGDKAAA